MRTQTNTAAAAADGASTMEKLRDALQTAWDAIQSPKGKKAMHWLRVLLSLGSVFYLVGILKLAYYSVFYDLQIVDAQQKAFCWHVSVICFFFTLLLLITRRQIITKLCIMLSMPFHLFIFLFNYEYRVLILPMTIMILLTYFMSGVGEGPKTIFGAIYVMLYIIGAFLFMAAGTLLAPTSVETDVENGVSKLGNYRYSVVQVEDKADGSTYIAIEPHTYDIKLDDCILLAKGFEKKTYVQRPMAQFQTEWVVDTRANITAQLLKNNPDTTFSLNAKQVEQLGLADTYTQVYTVGAMNLFQRRRLGICIKKDLIGGQTPESEGLTLYESADEITLTYAQIQKAGLDIEYTVRLADLTDADLAALGVPEENDVLQVNGKVVFRQYVAVLENTYAVSNRSLESFFD